MAGAWLVVPEDQEENHAAEKEEDSRRQHEGKEPQEKQGRKLAVDKAMRMGWRGGRPSGGRGHRLP